MKQIRLLSTAHRKPAALVTVLFGKSTQRLRMTPLTQAVPTGCRITARPWNAGFVFGAPLFACESRAESPRQRPQPNMRGQELGGEAIRSANTSLAPGESRIGAGPATRSISTKESFRQRPGPRGEPILRDKPRRKSVIDQSSGERNQSFRLALPLL